MKEAEVEKILNDSFIELEKNIESADLSKETINTLVELMYECINTAHGRISDEIKSERVMQKFTAIDLEDILKENYVNKNKIREIMITNTNKLNKSVNEILKRIYKARIELCKELLKGDE